MSGYGQGLYGEGLYGVGGNTELKVTTDLPVIAARTRANPLTGTRKTRYRFDLLDDSGLKFGELDGVSSGSLEWNANSQVKGGGKIVVDRNNSVFSRKIRVAKNYPLVSEVDFEVDTEGFAYDDGGGLYDPPSSITRDTDTFYEGGASLKIDWQSGSTQKVSGAVGSVTAGETYTVVARILNAASTAANISVEVEGETGGWVLATRPDWQTVLRTFVADATGPVYFSITNFGPEAGEPTYINNLALYEGEAEGFNGEQFTYAPFSWLHARVRPVLMIDGVKDTPLGVFIPSAPIEQRDEAGGRQEIELLDRTSVLSQDFLEKTFTVAKGANIITTVRKVINSTGERPGALTASPEVTNAAMSWPAGTNKLTVINELLDTAGFFSLWADANGQFRAEHYRPPANRSVRYNLLDDQDSIYIPTLTIEEDIYSIPNKIVMTAQGDGENEAWVAVAKNVNPNSPYSWVNRGRWITDVQQGVEATSEANLQAKAVRRLVDLTSVQATIEIQHAPVPLKVNDVVRFRNKKAGVNTLFTVTKTAVNFDPLSLAKTTLTEVIDLDAVQVGGTS